MATRKVESVEELKPVYYLYGTEELLMEEALRRLIGLLSREVDPDFNLEVLSSEQGLEHIIDSAETVPLLSQRRLVVVREIDRLSRKDQEALSQYLENQNPATTLVLVAHFPVTGERRDSNAQKRTENSALFKAARKHGEVLHFTMAGRGGKQKLDRWLTEQFARHGKKVEPAARALLLEKVGGELRELSDAVERVCLYTGESEVVTRADVDRVASSLAEQGVFEFVDAVAERRRDLSLYLLNKLLRQGESPHMLFQMLLRQFRLITRVKAMGPERSTGEAAAQLGVPPFVVSKCMNQARRYSSDRLRSVFTEFKKAQVELHSSKYLSEREYQGTVLELLVAKVIG